MPIENSGGYVSHKSLRSARPRWRRMASDCFRRAVSQPCIPGEGATALFHLLLGRQQDRVRRAVTCQSSCAGRDQWAKFEMIWYSARGAKLGATQCDAAAIGWRLCRKLTSLGWLRLPRGTELRCRTFLRWAQMPPSRRPD
jgi:hypothetical protein